MHNEVNGVRYTVNQIIRVAVILQRKVPGDIVPLILDFAELWTVVAAAAEARSCRITKNNAGLVVLRCTLPPGMPTKMVRRVRFAIVSRDQGWSTFYKDHGTYRNSWTWFEAGIKPKQTTGMPQIEASPNLGSDSELRLDPNREGEGFAGPPSVLPKTEYVSRDGYTLPPRTIITNVHASNQWMTHVATWDISHEDDKIRDALRTLKSGDSIELSTYARFPGWVNNLRYALIEVEGLCVRKV